MQLPIEENKIKVESPKNGGQEAKIEISTKKKEQMYKSMRNARVGGDQFISIFPHLTPFPSFSCRVLPGIP